KLIIAVAALVAVALPLRAAAQETDTEKTAARDVLRKMAELEQSLDVPGLVAKLTGPDARRDVVVARAKALMDTELLAMADDIATDPETGFEEKRSVGTLPEYLRQHDFDVQMGVANLPTAFVAKYTGTTGSPNLGIIVEYDALRGTAGPFHGDQHSAQGPVGLAGGGAISEVLTTSPTPAAGRGSGNPAER